MTALAELATARLLLRPLALSDAADVLALHADSRVTDPLIDGVPRTLEHVGLYVHYSEASRAAGLPGVMHARLQANGAFIGVFSLTAMDDGTGVDLGARHLPAGWGRGLAVEGGAALLNHAFNDLALDQVTSMTSADNRTVPYVLAQLGYQCDGPELMFGRAARRFSITATRWAALGGRPLGRREAMAVHAGFALA